MRRKQNKIKSFNQSYFDKKTYAHKTYFLQRNEPVYSTNYSTRAPPRVHDYSSLFPASMNGLQLNYVSIESGEKERKKEKKIENETWIDLI